MARPIKVIAQDINEAWSNVNYAAAPYLDAMFELNSINDMYYEDPARQIVGYFLSNARSFRGDKAKELKQELKTLISCQL